MAGAPKGNNNASIGRQGRKALEIALKNFDATKDDPYEGLEVVGVIRTLILMWKPIITKALVDGDLMAMKEINDRLDGKAVQQIDVADNTEARVDELSDEALTDIATNGSD